jgi:hypothetical protein
MEKEALRQALASNLPITIVTASGKSYEVEHQDYISIAPEDATTVIVYARGERGFTILDLKTITDVSIHGVSA